MNARRRLLSLVLLAAAGCARPQQSQPAAFAWTPSSSGPAEVAPGQEGLPAPPPAEGSGSVLAKIDAEQRPAPAMAIPGGDACVAELARRGIAFSPRQAERGVATPVFVKGDIGGIRFFSDATPFIADCRLVLALSELAPELAELGVKQVRFSGAYVYRVKTTGSGRLSLHAHGLAIDVHDVWFGSERLNVKVNYTRGLGRDCQPNLPRLNDLACRIRERRLFKELLTPDDNADHHDHFHFGLAPLPGEVPPEPPVVLHKPVRKVPPGGAQPTAVHDRHSDAVSAPEKPKAQKPKAQKPKVEPKAEEPKAEEPKAEEPKAEEPKAEEPKADEPKADKPGNDPPTPPSDATDDEIAPIESDDPVAPGSLPEMAPERG